MSINRTIVETRVCDVTGDTLGEVGWAIVRLYDDVEVAHFKSLTHLRGCDVLHAAVWAVLHRQDEEYLAACDEVDE